MSLKRKFIILVLFILTAALLLSGFMLIQMNAVSFVKKSFTNYENSQEIRKIELTDIKNGSVIKITENETDNNQLSLSFFGDIMLARDVDRRSKKAGNAQYPFLLIKDFLQQADVQVANLEGAIVKDYFSVPDFSTLFSFAPEKAKILADAGFDYLSQANNHTNDPYPGAWLESSKILADNNIIAFGQATKSGQDRGVLLEKNGQKVRFFGLYNFASDFDQDKALANIASQTSRGVLDVVFVHWGTEYQTTHNQNQEKLAHLLIDHGVDIIIGHHPHVVQDIERYHDKYIFYSLGNFIFDQYFSEDVQTGLSVKLTLSPLENKMELYPLKIELAQSSLMLDPDKNNFINNLLENSQLKDFYLNSAFLFDFD